jgi:hypothetical protein
MENGDLRALRWRIVFHGLGIVACHMPGKRAIRPCGFQVSDYPTQYQELRWTPGRSQRQWKKKLLDSGHI